MADAKIKKTIGNVTKICFFSCIYRKYVILTWKADSNSSNFIYIYDFSNVMAKYGEICVQPINLTI